MSVLTKPPAALPTSALSAWTPLARSVGQWLFNALTFLAVWGLGMLPALWMMPWASHPDQDMSHFRYWIAWLTERGIEQAYSGIFPAGYIIYPPLSLHFFYFVGQLFAAFPTPPEGVAPFWPADGNWQNALVRTPVVVFHGLLGALIYWSTVRWKGVRWAVPAAIGYLINPAVLFDLVYWAQPDSYHSLFSVLALLLLLGPWPEFGWASVAIAAMAKPQAWIYLPILLIVTWRRHGLSKVASGAVFFLTALLAVVWPFIVADRGWELASVFVNFSRVMPVVSANAHNFWWAVLGENALFKADSAIAFGPFSYQSIGLALLLGTFFMAVLKSIGDDDRKTLFSTAGFASLAFFMFATQIHENHAFLVFPMLAMCWVADWRLGIVYVVLSATMFGNMALHDPILEPLAGPWLAENTPEWLPETLRQFTTPAALQVVSIAANFFALGVWLVSFVLGGPAPVSSVERQRRAAWGGALGGLATAVLLAVAGALMLMPPSSGETSGLVGDKISTKPVEEPHLRIIEGGGGTDDPEARRLQTVYLTVGAAGAIAIVTLAYVAHQGAVRGQRRS